ncbi:MAG: beta-galactosidase [Tyzzerella sp.]|nr:beta-galactosidase [Tyzzerella sp.]
MIFDNIIHGTQYYRTPTPLPEEWEGDIANMADFHLDAMQIRINWRWNERRENEYDFSDVDCLMELAEKYNRKVIIKFLLECAPQYIFDKYGGSRIGPKGETLRGGAHGAFYGGWRPCFTNPKVQERAILFVEKVAQRYAHHKNLILWNAWNEIRNKPIEDCFCPHCRKAFGDYLKDKFGTIEELNQFYGAAEESFETIALPAMPHGYWDIYEYKNFKGSSELHNWLKFVYDAIKKYDKKHPVMSHVGYAAAFQNHLGDVCDDYEVAKAVDFFGTSIPCDCAMDTMQKRLDYLMLNAYMRSVDSNYFVHEIYPGLGMFKKAWYDKPFDMRFKLYSSLACGTKGLVYWQYRAERVGHENDCAGIMRMDGSPRPVAYEVAEFGKYLERDMEYFVKASPEQGQIGILFDFQSLLLSEIEDSCGPDYEFDLYNPKSYYRNAHAGMYRMARKLDYTVDYVQAKDISKFNAYKVIYVPYGSMLSNDTIVALTDYVKSGGILILDEGFAMRQPNTWMNPYDLNCEQLFQGRLRERREVWEDFAEYKGRQVRLCPYQSEYEIVEADSFMTYSDGKTAIHKTTCGKGSAYLMGFSLGYGYYITEDPVFEELFLDMVQGAQLQKKQYSDFKNGVYEEALYISETTKIIFIFNVSEDSKVFNVCQPVLRVGGDFTAVEDGYRLDSHQIGYWVTSTEN